MKRQKLQKKLEHYIDNHQNLVIGSLIVLSFIMMPILPSLNQHNPSAQTATYAFALAIPTLTFFLLIKQAFILSKNKNFPVIGSLMVVIGLLSSVVGLTSIFGYILPKAAVVFIIVSAICFTIYQKYEAAVMRDWREKEQSGKRRV